MIYLSITPFFPTDTFFNGPFIYDQVRAIEKTGKFERVIVFKPCGLLTKERHYNYQGVEVCLFPKLSFPSMFSEGIFDKVNDMFFRQRLKEIGISPTDISVAHAHTAILAHYVVNLKKVNPKLQAVVQYHDPDPLTMRLGKVKNWAWHQRLCGKYRVRLLSQCDWHVGVSQMVLGQLSAFPESECQCYGEYLKVIEPLKGLPKVSIKNSVVLYNGVDLEKFYPADRPKITRQVDHSLNETRNGARGELKTDNGVPPSCAGDHTASLFRIGCVASCSEWKSQMTLLKAISRLHIKGLGVVLVGSGDSLNECKRYVAEHGLSDIVEFKTEMDHRLLRDFYCSLNLFVLPSYFEGFGCVFLEAFACGVPFICCKGQGISEYIHKEDENKWMIDPGDDAGLAQRIERYYLLKEAQHLKYPIDIDSLVSGFVKRVVG